MFTVAYWVCTLVQRECVAVRLSMSPVPHVLSTHAFCLRAYMHISGWNVRSRNLAVSLVLLLDF